MQIPPSLVHIPLPGEIPGCAVGSTVVLVSVVRCWCVRSATGIWCLVSLLSEVVIWPHPSAVTGAPLVGARQAVGRVLKAGLPLWPGRIPGAEPVSVPLDFVSVSKGRPKALHSVVPRGFLAGSNARRRLVAAFCACLCACAHCATSDKNRASPFAEVLLLAVFPSEFVGDIHDSWWESRVLILSIVSWWDELSLLILRRTPRWLLVLVGAWQWLRPLRVRDELPPRRVSRRVCGGARRRRSATAAICAGLRQKLVVQLLCIRARTFLFGCFVIVRSVSPMLHGPSRSRKPLARTVAERARGTTSGSPRRVSYHGGSFCTEHT